jgi:hypothetical protein
MARIAKIHFQLRQVYPPLFTGNTGWRSETPRDAKSHQLPRDLVRAWGDEALRVATHRFLVGRGQ